MKVLHCPLNTAGNPAALARAEREVGLSSWSVAWAQSSLAFPTDEILWYPGITEREQEKRRRQLLWRAIREFDVIHFNWGETILPIYHPRSIRDPLPFRTWIHARRRDIWRKLIEYRDLPLLRALGKVIAVTYQGDDARQGDICKERFQISPVGNVPADYYTAASDARKRRNIARFNRHADLIYTVSLDLLSFLPERACYLPYATIDPKDWNPPRDWKPNSIPMLLHAPTHQGVKGTKFVLEAVSRLKSEGIPLRFVLVENIPHGEVQALYAQADLLVDQLLVGFYGALSVELMAMAKPVVCYLRDEDLNRLPVQMRQDLPIINATPASIYDVLKSLLTLRREELAEIGARGRDFARRWHNPIEIARRTAEDYQRAWDAKRSNPVLGSIQRLSRAGR